jgi:hypothetical protein
MPTALFLSFAVLAQSEAPEVGRSPGSLIVDGGAENADSIKRFVALAGGPDAPIVVIPTASETDPIDVKRHLHTLTRRSLGEPLFVMVAEGFSPVRDV